MAEEKLIIVMVGLPARGKSYITRKIFNYLQWLNIEGKVFNVGNKRRKNLDDEQNADFFDPNDEQNVKIRDELAMQTLDEVLDYLSAEGQVGIFDATNSTVQRRSMVVQHIHATAEARGFTNYNILFLESICNDSKVIMQNILLKLNGPDYKGQDRQTSLNDFQNRLANYETAYESVSAEEIAGDKRCQFIKIVNIYDTQSSADFHGFLPIILLNFLSNFNIAKKKIWISLPHIDSTDIIKNVADTDNLTIFNSSETADKRLPLTLNIDQVHDLILDIEKSTRDILIQTQDEFLINGVLKYFQLMEHCHPDLTTQVLCILPHHYSVGIQEYNIHDVPDMTRSNSTASNASSLITPKEDFNWKKFSYQNLNINELTSKLKDLPPGAASQAPTEDTITNEE